MVSYGDLRTDVPARTQAVNQKQVFVASSWVGSCRSYILVIPYDVMNVGQLF